MIPQTLFNTNMFIGGQSLQGDVPSLSLPKVTVKTEEYRGGGMDAPVAMDMGLEKLEASFATNGVRREVLKYFGAFDQTGFDASFRNEVADVVNQLVGAGMELKQAMEFAPVAAKFVVGQGSSGVDTAKMIQALQSNANITDPKVLEKALEAVAFQGQAGSFEASDMARWFPQLLASMQKQGITGMDAVTQLGAMLQGHHQTVGRVAKTGDGADGAGHWGERRDQSAGCVQDRPGTGQSGPGRIGRWWRCRACRCAVGLCHQRQGRTGRC